nr:MAG TPA: hypothetical protein [Bacteriophage sp.]
MPSAHRDFGRIIEWRHREGAFGGYRCFSRPFSCAYNWKSGATHLRSIGNKCS